MAQAAKYLPLLLMPVAGMGTTISETFSFHNARRKEKQNTPLPGIAGARLKTLAPRQRSKF